MPRSPEPARQALIAAAERLFAERGVDAVPVGDVVKAAEQRNSSAVQYHFGNKEGLLRAILEPHQTRLDAERVELLDRLDGPQTVEAVIEALVRPLASLLDTESGRCYLMIQAQLVGAGDLGDPGELLARRPGLARAMTLLHELTGDDPDDNEWAGPRQTLTAILLLHGLADFARRRPDASPEERATFTDLMGRCVTSITLTPAS